LEVDRVHALADASTNLRLNANGLDYALVAVYFVLVLGIGLFARRSVSSSLDFFLSGRSLPAWVTGLAFISANLGAVEIFGMVANGAEYGVPMVHYYWIGAIPAMVFLGIIMMPFYYGSKVRSVPEFMRRRFGNAAHLVNALSFALAQVLIAGVNLYALASVVQALLGWSLWVSIVVGAAVVLTYTTLGGMTAAIYNEVLQFFVILALLIPLTIIGLHKVGGWDGLKSKLLSADPTNGHLQLNSWPATNLTGIHSPVLSVIGLVFGLGFVLSFGYWTTNFAEVQRALSAKDMSAARRTPLIGAYPKTIIALLVLIPGMVAATLDGPIKDLKAAYLSTGATTLNDIKFSNTIEVVMGQLLPNGLLGVGIAGLLAAFMAGMAANVSSFNTVFTYDILQAYIKKNKEDGYYLKAGRWITVIGTIVAIGTAFIAANSGGNIMDYLQKLFGFFNAPLFATFILGMFWKRMSPAAGAIGLVVGTLSAVTIDQLNTHGVITLSGQGASFVAASAAFIMDIVVSILVTLVTKPKPESELTGLVWSLTPRGELLAAEGTAVWYRKPAVLAGGALILAAVLNIIFW
jgi:SSS family solute:Na+ symporter